MKRLLAVHDLGCQPYNESLAVQEQTVSRRRSGACSDTLLLVEHEPVYTLGRRFKPENLRASQGLLRAKGAGVVEVGRGGDVTFHGPGQLVGYPIISLVDRAGAAWYVAALETVLVRTLAVFGMASDTDARNRGVWIGNEKIAAIGVRVSRGVTMHGFALNVCVDLSWYDDIVPCGIQDAGVTSMDCHVPGMTTACVKPVLLQQFCDVFEYKAGKAMPHVNE